MSCLFGLHVMRLLNFRRDTDLPQAHAAGSPLDAVIDDNSPQRLLLIDLMQLKHIVRGESGLQPAAYGIAPGFDRQVVLFLKTAVLVSQIVGIANLGAEEACRRDEALMKGLNTYQGHVTYKAVADDQGLPYVDPTTLF